MTPIVQTTLADLYSSKLDSGNAILDVAGAVMEWTYALTITLITSTLWWIVDAVISVIGFVNPSFYSDNKAGEMVAYFATYTMSFAIPSGKQAEYAVWAVPVHALVTAILFFLPQPYSTLAVLVGGSGIILFFFIYYGFFNLANLSTN